MEADKYNRPPLTREYLEATAADCILKLRDISDTLEDLASRTGNHCSSLLSYVYMHLRTFSDTIGEAVAAYDHDATNCTDPPLTAEEIVLTHGIAKAAEASKEFAAQIGTAVRRFLASDFGTMYEEDEEPQPGAEYGMYKTTAAPIFLHREAGHIVIYFEEER